MQIHHILWKTSGYTILVVDVDTKLLSSVIRIVNLSGDFTRYNGIYSCPWVKTDLGKYKPTFDKVWPWLLLMDITNTSVKETDVFEKSKKKLSPRVSNSFEEYKPFLQHEVHIWLFHRLYFYQHQQQLV